MGVYSSGVKLYRFVNGELQVMLIHPGGPFWAKKDEGVWSIPKGIVEAGEDPRDAAKREFQEETGFIVDGGLIDLGEIKQPSRKIVRVFAVEQDIDISGIESNLFSLEWPPKSGNIHEFPEVDRGGWFDVHDARIKLQKGQVGFLDRLMEKLGYIP